MNGLTELILLGISFVPMCIYLFYISGKYGIQKSISETYYTIGKKWWFTILLYSWMLPLIIVGLELMDSPYIFLGGAAIMFVATAPAFKITETTERKVHMVGSYLGVGLTLLSVAFDFNYYILAGLVALMYLLLLTEVIKLKNKIWWIEIFTYLLIYTLIFIKI